MKYDGSIDIEQPISTVTELSGDPKNWVNIKTDSSRKNW